MSFSSSQKRRSTLSPKSRLQSLSQDELSIYQATFDLYANSEGHISANDLCQMLQTVLGQPISLVETKEIIREINGTDRITFENFCTFLLDEDEDEDDQFLTDEASTPGSAVTPVSPYNRNHKRKHSSYPRSPVPSQEGSRTPVLRRSSSWASQSQPTIRTAQNRDRIFRSFGKTSQQYRLSEMVSDSVSDAYSSFSSSSSRDDVTPRSSSSHSPQQNHVTSGALKHASTPAAGISSATQISGTKRPPIRRETTIYGSQLLKHPIRIENPTMQNFVRQTHDLHDVFNSLPKNSKGKVKAKDIKRALISLSVPESAKAMKILEKKDSMDLKQFITFFQLNVDQS